MRSIKNKFQENRIFVLNDPNSPRLSSNLALEIGLNESILLLQLEFWISISNNVREGRKWTYQSIRDIQEFFPFWSVGTIHTIIKSLEDKKLIIKKTFNVRKNDKTQWFSLNFESISNLKSITVPDQKKTVQELNKVFRNQTAHSETEQRCSETEQTLFRNRTTLPEKENTKTTQKDLVGFPEEDQKKITRTDDIRQLFEKWFKFYPRHEQKEKAYKIFFEKGLYNGKYEDLVKATRNFKIRTENYPDDKITMPVNFLMKYEDEL